jgi:hypothetical protein
MPTYFARARILANPKNVPGPIRGARTPDHIPSTRKMFIDLSGFRSSHLIQAANLKNVLGPIRADLSLMRVISTRKMFLDLSGVSAARDRMLSLKMFLDLSCLSFAIGRTVPTPTIFVDPSGGDGDCCKQRDDIVRPR